MSIRGIVRAAAAAAVAFGPATIRAEDPFPAGRQAGIYIGAMEIAPSVEEAAAASGRRLSLRRVSESLETQFVSALSATRVFQIVERKRQSEIAQEQGFSAVNTPADDKDKALRGQFAGAKYALLPRIDGFEDLVDVERYKAIDRSSMRRRLFLSATVSIVDTTSGRLLPDVASAQMTQEEIVENSRTGAGLQGGDIALVELARKAANQLCQDAIAILRPAKVLAITGGQILINRGTPSGFKPGAPVEFFGFEEVVDEDSGESFRNEIPVGKGTITRADAKQSYAALVGEDLGVAKGCVARLARQEPAARTPVPVSAPGGSFPEDPRRVPRSPAPETPGSAEAPLDFGSDAISGEPEDGADGGGAESSLPSREDAAPEGAGGRDKEAPPAAGARGVAGRPPRRLRRPNRRLAAPTRI